ncbi:Ca-activated chloride channel family protein [Microbacter margulisiae]|uniref:Ca-activated chloride channel family protein n=2 Tax=Microbacter margulisiae TaxID=1350067 RepID=A0A7W5DS00_9PORP|nr:Ca-activated chloride channel family protein [Microbacter margulisiae]
MKRKNIARFGNPELVKSLMPNYSSSRPVVKFYLLLAAMTLIILALARPQFGTGTETVKRHGIQVMIAVDVSNSMRATDVSPDRLDVAKQLLSSLIDKLSNDQIGIVVFAGEAQVQLPITSDNIAAKMFLSNISTNMISYQGTAIGSAIDLSLKSLASTSKAGRAIVLLTDGENFEDNAIDAAKLAAKKGIMVDVVGVGTPQGSPIPISGTMSYMKDQQGNVVVTHLNEQMCKEIAAAGKGIYVRADNSDNALRAVNNSLQQLATAPIENEVYSTSNEQFVNLAWLAFFLLLIDMIILERKNKWINQFKWF